MRHCQQEKKKTPELLQEVLPDTEADQGHEKKLGRYGAAKLHQAAVLDFILLNEPLLFKEAEALRDCGTWLVFRHWYTVGQYRLIAGCSCKKHLLCGLCALRRAARQVREYEKRIKLILSDHPEYVPVLITRTIRNGEDLSERYEHLTLAHKKMIQWRRDSIKKRTTARGKKSILRFVKGSAGSYEFKKGEHSGEWHPHSHEIALLDRREFQFTDLVRKGKQVSVPLSFESRLAQEWLKMTGDSWIVDVRRIDASDDEKLLKALCEAFKYALKFTALEIPDQVEAYKVLRGRRLCFSYGCLWGVKVSDYVVDDIEEALKLLPYVDLVYSFIQGEYIHTSTTDIGDLEPKGQKSDKYRKKARSVVSKRIPFTADYVKKWVKDADVVTSARMPDPPF